MNRLQGIILGTMSAVLLGACASSGGGSAGVEAAAPEVDESAYGPSLASPSDNEFTARAGLFLAQAAGTEGEAERREKGQQALAQVQQGLQQDTMNPKLWLMKGQAEVAMGNYDAADASFTRALEIYPAYTPQIEAEREQGWIDAFNAGVQAMNAGDTEAAIAAMERAQSIFNKRPEALLNLASLYLRQEQPDKAAETYARTLEILTGPAATELPAEITAEWPTFIKLARTNMAQVYASMGVEHFRAEEYDAAAADFRAALEVNPYYRDALHNLSQSLYVWTTDLEESREGASAARTAEIDAQLREVYGEFREVTEQVKQIDPYNQNVNLLLARAYRGLGQIATADAEKKEWQSKALAVLEENQKLPFQITNVQVQLGDSAVQIAGDLENIGLTQGDQVTLRVTMLDAEGQSAGTQDVTITAPAQKSSTNFTVSVPVSEPSLGWRYEVIGA